MFQTAKSQHSWHSHVKGRKGERMYFVWSCLVSKKTTVPHNLLSCQGCLHWLQLLFSLHFLYPQASVLFPAPSVLPYASTSQARAKRGHGAQLPEGQAYSSAPPNRHHGDATTTRLWQKAIVLGWVGQNERKHDLRDALGTRGDGDWKEVPGI